VDHARARTRLKRGGKQQQVPLDEDLTVQSSTGPDVLRILQLDEALDDFARTEPDKARIVEMRFFSGLTMEEIAAVLGVSTRTVERHWRFARAWLYRELADHGDA
jgi:RNA polymerase sigma factor (TIGR02999 family)